MDKFLVSTCSVVLCSERLSRLGQVYDLLVELRKANRLGIGQPAGTDEETDQVSCLAAYILPEPAQESEGLIESNIFKINSTLPINYPISVLKKELNDD